LHLNRHQQLLPVPLDLQLLHLVDHQLVLIIEFLVLLHPGFVRLQQEVVILTLIAFFLVPSGQLLPLVILIGI
jgi:hypothetical protein